jgi:hypothetical protein
VIVRDEVDGRVGARGRETDWRWSFAETFTVHVDRCEADGLSRIGEYRENVECRLAQ